MVVDESATIQLIMSPSVSPENLATQVDEEGAVISASVSLTDRMRAELRAADPDAFDIQALHDNPEQLLGTTEPTEWRWTVTAKKPGLQELTLTVYRLVTYEGQEYWPQVSYEAMIDVNVTWPQRLGRVNWEWLLGILLTGLMIPAVWRWADKRRRKRSRRKA
jgi:hypothetical protein